MNRGRFCALVLGLCIAVSGCQVQSMGNQKLSREARVRAIEEGTSKEQVRGLLGQPAQVRFRVDDRGEVWVSRYRKSVRNYASSHGEHVQLQLSFNDDGHVVDVNRATWTY